MRSPVAIFKWMELEDDLGPATGSDNETLAIPGPRFAGAHETKQRGLLRSTRLEGAYHEWVRKMLAANELDLIAQDVLKLELTDDDVMDLLINLGLPRDIASETARRIKWFLPKDD